MGGLIAASSLAAYALGEHWGGVDLATSMTFATLVGAQLAASLTFRSESQPFYTLRNNPWLWLAIAGSLTVVLAVFSVPFLKDIFDVTALAGRELGAVVLLSLLPLTAGEAAKGSGLLHRFNVVPTES
jgi:magnesium-transporting ATPase (P-type)